MQINISGSTLQSLRKRYKMSTDVAAKLTGYDKEDFEHWEDTGTQLNLTDTRKLAKVFNAHWSVFLQKSKVPTIKEAINHRAGYSDNSKFSLATYHAYESGRQLINASIEVGGQDVNPALGQIGQTHTKASSTELARHVRDILSITSDEIRSVKGGPREIYKFWAKTVSDAGVYVSEQDMPTDETKAFLMREASKAVIVVSRNDRYPLSKAFSLLHELGHLISGEKSAACSIEMYAKRSSPVETKANKFASEMMAFDSDVLKDPLTETVKASLDPASIIKRLSSKYRVSFTVMLYKLKAHEKVTPAQCTEMQNFFEYVILPQYEPKPLGDDFRMSRRNFVIKDVSKASSALSKEVISKQISGALSYGEAAKLLGTKARYIEDIKSVVGFGS